MYGLSTGEASLNIFVEMLSNPVALFSVIPSIIRLIWPRVTSFRNIELDLVSKHGDESISIKRLFAILYPMLTLDSLICSATSFGDSISGVCHHPVTWMSAC